MIITKKVKILVAVREARIKTLNVWYSFAFKCMLSKVFGYKLEINTCREHKKYHLYIEILVFLFDRHISVYKSINS